MTYFLYFTNFTLNEVYISIKFHSAKEKFRLTIDHIWITNNAFYCKQVIFIITAQTMYIIIQLFYVKRCTLTEIENFYILQLF